VIEVERQRNDLALFHQPGGRDDIFGAGVIERADLVGRAPFAPVLVFLGGGGHVFTGELAGRHGSVPLRLLF